ncbi:MAG: hypothetical protein HUU49_03690 [Candidatus Buchananbacteria bacterium]|nr:hypothetical protein [Candidatus Buchananbacteria bacterium]
MKRFIFICIFAVGVLFFSPAASATTIFSPIIELEAAPGETVNGLVKLFNETAENVVLSSVVEAFTSGDETGQPVYLPPEAQYDYLNWFAVEQKEITLTPRQVALVPFTVKVPFDAVPGGYYAVIFWQTSLAGENQAPVGINSRVGTLVFLKISGAVTESGEVSDFGLKQPDTFFELPVDFTVRFTNSGNIHLRPTGTVEVKNIFGQKHYLEINPERRNVLPNSTRLFEVVWGSVGNNTNLVSTFLTKLSQEFDFLAIGPHTATLELEYGSTSPQRLTETISFSIWPWRLLLTGVVLVVIVVFLIRLNNKINRLKKKLTKKINE